MNRGPEQINEAVKIIEEYLLSDMDQVDLPQELQEHEAFMAQYQKWQSIKKFTFALAEGDLSQALLTEGQMSGALKSLQGNLRQLTWKTKQIAVGDFSQQVEFMRDYSEAFNQMAAALKQTENNLKADRIVKETVLEAITQGLLLLDQEQRVLLYNQQFVRMMDIKAEDVYIGQLFSDLLTLWGKENGQTEKFVEKVLEKITYQKSHQREYSWQAASRDERWIHMDHIPLPGGILLRTFTDITERRQSERTLRESEASFRSIFEAAPFPVAVMNSNGRILHGNQRLIEFYEVAEAEFNQLYPLELFVDRLSRKQLLRNLRRKGKIDEFETQVRTVKTGQIRWVVVSARMIQLHGQECLMTMQLDITERKRMEEKLRRLATSDGLTGLTNRRHFLELAEQEMSRVDRYKGNLAVLVFDIDHFKRINDTYGHLAGDQVLKEMSLCFRAALRDIDVIGRIGGEEFSAFLPATNLTGALEAAERLRQTVAEHFFLISDQQKIQATISVGVTIWKADDQRFDALLRRADQGLYLAKNSGRNQVRQWEDFT